MLLTRNTFTKKYQVTPKKTIQVLHSWSHNKCYFHNHLIFNPETRWPFLTKTLLETLLVIWKHKITMIKPYSVKWVSCMNTRTSLWSILAPYLLLVSNTPFNYFRSTSRQMLNDWHLFGRVSSRFFRGLLKGLHLSLTKYIYPFGTQSRIHI